MARYSAEFWQARIDEQRKGKSTIAEYCRKRGLSRYTFLRWRGRLEGGRACAGLVEIGKTAEPREPFPAGSAITVCIGEHVRIHFPEPMAAARIGEVVAAVRAAT